MFSLIYACANGWVNNPDAGDVSLHRTYHDVIAIDQALLGARTSAGAVMTRSGNQYTEVWLRMHASMNSVLVGPGNVCLPW